MAHRQKPLLVTLDCAQTLLQVHWQPGELAVGVLADLGATFDPIDARSRYESLLRDRWRTFQELNLQKSEAVCRVFWDQLASDWLSQISVPGSFQSEFSRVADERLMAPNSELIRPYADALPALSSLQRGGYRLAVISNWDTSLHRALRTHGLYDFFELVIASLEEGFEKPDPEIFRLALQRLSIDPGEAVHVGDDWHDDVVGARNAGLYAIHLDRESDESTPTRIRSLSELPGGADIDRLSDYDYVLPPEAIAQEPLADRAASRLLWLHRDSGEITHHRFSDVPEILQPKDLLILNNTRVTALRLFGKKTSGGQVEALLLHQDPLERTFVALMKPGKRLPPRSEVVFADDLTAIILEDLGEGKKRLQFGQHSQLEEGLQSAGRVPLPPYITHELDDAERYQTVYAKTGGSAAAPTAGLHFTSEIIESFRHKNVKTCEVSLDVGLDTFRQVMNDDLSHHIMHGELCRVDPPTAAAIKGAEGRIIAVGTTSVRTVESFATGIRQVQTGELSTQLFIRPGFDFKIIDGMFTNFHMPRTTMLMMISALAGREHVFAAYREALAAGYRMLSFGDSMLIL